MKAQHHIASGWSFVITPVLDRGWGYDPYVRNLIGRIRAGRPALPCLFDFNSLWLGSGQDTVLQRYAAKKREISAAEMAEYRGEQEKRRLATEAVYAKQNADREARAAERQREERDWKAKLAGRIRKDEDREKEWAAAKLQAKEWAVATRGHHGVRIPLAGWWREQGADVVVAVMLQGHKSTEVLVGPEGAGLWIAKQQIKLVKDHLDGLHELTLDGEFAKRMGLCEGEPKSWIS